MLLHFGIKRSTCVIRVNSEESHGKEDGAGVPKNRGTFLGGPNNQDCSIYGVYIRAPLFRGTTIWKMK